MLHHTRHLKHHALFLFMFMFIVASFSLMAHGINGKFVDTHKQVYPHHILFQIKSCIVRCYMSLFSFVVHFYKSHMLVKSIVLCSNVYHLISLLFIMNIFSAKQSHVYRFRSRCTILLSKRYSIL